MLVIPYFLCLLSVIVQTFADGYPASGTEQSDCRDTRIMRILPSGTSSPKRRDPKKMPTGQHSWQASRDGTHCAWDSGIAAGRRRGFEVGIGGQTRQRGQSAKAMEEDLQGLCIWGMRTSHIWLGKGRDMEDLQYLDFILGGHREPVKTQKPGCHMESRLGETEG